MATNESETLTATATSMRRALRHMDENDISADGITVSVSFEVCDTCEGSGTTWHGRPSWDAVTFTSSEWHDMDDDSRDGYMSGRYDGPCPECQGLRVTEIAEVSTNRGASSEAIAFLTEWFSDMADLAACERAEQRYFSAF